MERGFQRGTSKNRPARRSPCFQ